MLKKLKNKTDALVIQKVKSSLIKASENNGIQIQEILTPVIEKKFDELAQIILKEHSYSKLARFGLKNFL